MSRGRRPSLAGELRPYCGRCIPTTTATRTPSGPNTLRPIPSAGAKPSPGARQTRSARRSPRIPRSRPAPRPTGRILRRLRRSWRSCSIPASPAAPRGPAPAPGSGRRPTIRRTAAPISARRIRHARRRKVSAKARRRITPGRNPHRSPGSIRSWRARSGSVRKTPPPYPPPQAGEGGALRQAGEGNGRSRPTSSPARPRPCARWSGCCARAGRSLRENPGCRTAPSGRRNPRAAGG